MPLDERLIQFARNNLRTPIHKLNYLKWMVFPPDVKKFLLKHPDKVDLLVMHYKMEEKPKLLQTPLSALYGWGAIITEKEGSIILLALDSNNNVVEIEKHILSSSDGPLTMSRLENLAKDQSQDIATRFNRRVVFISPSRGKEPYRKPPQFIIYHPEQQPEIYDISEYLPNAQASTNH